MKKKLILLFVAFIAANVSFAQGAKKKSPVDGKIFAITHTEQGKKKPEPIKDEVSFMTGKFKSMFASQAGFIGQPDYEYEIDSTSGKIIVKFTAEFKNNETQERFSLEGTVDDDKIEGTAIIRKKGKIESTFSFSGTQKNKKKARPAPAAKVAPIATDSTQVEEPKAE
ncbi:MAG: hypothetical protein JNL69_11695 [Bacteroidia bacterium]|nr:hypothetical protein [Bacteroidia bacterium]